MKVNVERDIDVERLLINLSEKSKCSSVGMAGYDVTVSKQMLRDAHDVIKQMMSEKTNNAKSNGAKIGDYKILIDSKEFGEKVLEYISSDELDKMINCTVFAGKPECRSAIIHGMSIASMLTSSCEPICVCFKQS